jgi:hypothetical protein
MNPLPRPKTELAEVAALSRSNLGCSLATGVNFNETLKPVFQIENYA